MLKRTKKTVAFLFKKMPADVFGFSQIKRNNVFLKQKWQDLSGPVCPHCAQAVMVLDTEREGVRRRSADGEDGETYTDLYHWVCPSELCGADEMLPENRLKPESGPKPSVTVSSQNRYRRWTKTKCRRTWKPTVSLRASCTVWVFCVWCSWPPISFFGKIP